MVTSHIERYAAPEKGCHPGFRSQNQRSCARKGAPPGISVTESEKLRPKRSATRDFGRRTREAAPKKGCQPGFRSQNQRSCARKGVPPGISVAEPEKLRPKRGVTGDYGRRTREAAPEKGCHRGLRSQNQRSCARKGAPPGITVAEPENLHPKRSATRDFGGINYFPPTQNIKKPGEIPPVLPFSRNEFQFFS
jgi:hypothetical protein